MNPSQIRPWITAACLGLIIASVGAYFRLYPLRHHRSNEATEKATLVVLSNLRQKFDADLRASDPQMSPAARQQAVMGQVNVLIKAERDKMMRTIDRVAAEIERESPATKNKVPYLLESDPFLYYSLTENVLATGRLSDTVKGSKYLNRLMLAPDGHWEPFTLHPYLGALVHRMMGLFHKDVPLTFSVSFVPLVVMVLSIIPFLFICRGLGCGTTASLTGGIFFFLMPIYLKRSMFGWYDNDPYSVLFSLCVIAVLFKWLDEQPLTMKHSLICGGWTAGLLSLYAMFWQGWMFLLVITVASIGGILIKQAVTGDRNSLKSLLAGILVTVAGSLAGIGLFFGPGEFFVLFQEGWKALTDFLDPQLSLWPDMYIAVGELRNATLGFIGEMCGGNGVLAVAGLGVLLPLLVPCVRAQHRRPAKLVVLVIFLAAAVKITLGAQRFVLLCAIPAGLLFTLGLQAATETILGLKRPAPRWLSVPLHLAVAALCVIAWRTSTLQAPAQLNQIYNDTWDAALRAVRERTPENSVVNAWWPPGHFIKTTAHRKVAFDGATINFPQGYWLANVFLASDERGAAGILRMLNTSANRAADLLLSKGIPLSQGTALLRKITALPRAEAGAQLRPLLGPEAAEELLRDTHGEPPPSYILLYNEFLTQSIQLPLVGNWNFQQIEEINADPARMNAVPKKGTREYIDFLWSVAGGMPRLSDPLDLVARSGDMLLFNENVQINLKDMTCQIRSAKFGNGRPLSVFFESGDDVVERAQGGATLSYSVVLFQENGGWKCLLAERSLAGSLITRLYYFNGKGLRYFRPVIRERSLTGRIEVAVFEVDWKRYLADLEKVPEGQ